MQNPIFNRYERKYVITQQQRKEMIEFLKDYLILDSYSANGLGYIINNIYYDTHDFSIIRNSISKPKYKEKLRLRSYRSEIKADDYVFIEIKKKFEGRINKRRIDLTYQQAIDYLEKGIKPSLNNRQALQILEEIDYFIKVHHAKPGALIRYRRLAFMAPKQDLRITFDDQMLFRNTNLDLTVDGGNPILEDPNYSLMEVKSEDNFPFWLARKLSEFELYSQSFSKYGTAYKQLLIGGTTDDYILFHY